MYEKPLIYRRTIQGASESGNGEPTILCLEEQGDYLFVTVSHGEDSWTLEILGSGMRTEAIERAVLWAYQPVADMLFRGAEISRCLNARTVIARPKEGIAK